MKKYVDLAAETRKGVAAYINDVQQGRFPSDAYEYK